MTATIDEIIMNACDLPTVPAVAQKVMKLMSDPNTNVSMICKSISSDQALTARILKISNSAFYGCLRTINSLQAATVIIGNNAIRSLVVAVSTKEVYKSFGLTEKMFWEHSVGVGIASQLLAKAAKVSKTDDVFVCGLMHDVGKVIMNNSNQELYVQVMEKTYNEGIPTIESEKEIFGFSHPEVGAMVVRKWNLTEELEKAILYHHNLEQLANEDEFINILGSIVHLADRFCCRLGIGTKAPDDSVEIKGTSAGEHLGFSDDQIDELLSAVEKTYAEEKNIFD